MILSSHTFLFILVLDTGIHERIAFMVLGSMNTKTTEIPAPQSGQGQASQERRTFTCYLPLLFLHFSIQLIKFFFRMYWGKGIPFQAKKCVSFWQERRLLNFIEGLPMISELDTSVKGETVETMRERIISIFNQTRFFFFTTFSPEVLLHTRTIPAKEGIMYNLYAEYYSFSLNSRDTYRNMKEEERTKQVSQHIHQMFLLYFLGVDITRLPLDFSFCEAYDFVFNTFTQYLQQEPSLFVKAPVLYSND